ncbi:MerR family transcriptional regulator [Actinoplanes sp. NPDC051494]|uniref:MerR family transcriptional regulator n=1 Tax=Actinoplanes sp. NPDC051494 TaxID=3363907 RepID=UPI0037BD529A
MNRSDIWLTTGEFGRRSGLSIKALRLYDTSGLLTPAQVNPTSHRRRYAVDQLERARRISLLRGLGMPPAMVAEVLAGSDAEGIAHLDRWWAGQEQAFEIRRSSIGWTRTRLLAGDSSEPGYDIRRRFVPATKIASVRRETDQHDLLDTIQRGEYEIRTVLQASGARMTAERWVIYHGFVTPESIAPIEICVPCTGAVEPAWDVAIRVEPAQDQVYATVTRDDCFYPRVMHAYAAVEAHVTAAALPVTAPPREIYVNYWSDIAGTDPFAYVAQPVFDQTAEES